MEFTVLKCDRCKKEVEGLIEFSFINRNIEPDNDDNARPLTALTASLFGQPLRKYPTVRGGLCLDCVKEISRWLGHQENILTNRM